ncbi:MAG: hypothetical protein M0Z71_15080 [Nitrospiraceae bacterium]|nr:hypothetical protein [Nitrospiraceae bacterium]
MMKGIFVLLAFVFLSSGVATAGPVEMSGGLDITGTPGTDGITFPDGTSQTSAVIGGQYQKRITATCSTGYAMRAIDSTGGVATCEPTGVSGILGTANGGTGTSTAPSTSGQYLRSTGAGA